MLNSPNSDRKGDTAKSSDPPVLASQRGVDYTPLRDLLAKAAQTNAPEAWKAADQETYAVMCQTLGKVWDEWTVNDVLNYPRTDLATIDQLWVYYSNGHFGFSVQKQVYATCRAKNTEHPEQSAWNEFCHAVGWCINNVYIPYSQVTFSTTAQQGHLPIVVERIDKGLLGRYGNVLPIP